MPGPNDTPSAAPTPAFFIHVMKTGGTTLFGNLLEHFAEDEVYPGPVLDLAHDGSKPVAFRPFTIRYLRTLSDERRRRIRFYVGHFPYVACEVLGGEFVTLTILRDPIERTVSLLRQLRRNPAWVDPRHGAPMATLSLEEVYELPQVFGPLIHNHQTKIFSMTLADEPTGFMQVIDVDESRLALARRNLAKVDVVGLTERYTEFVDEVTKRFGWPVKRDARVNETPVEHAQPVSDSLRRRIAADNAMDMEFYEYAIDLVRERRRSRAVTA